MVCPLMNAHDLTKIMTHAKVYQLVISLSTFHLLFFLLFFFFDLIACHPPYLWPFHVWTRFEETNDTFDKLTSWSLSKHLSFLCFLLGIARELVRATDEVLYFWDWYNFHLIISSIKRIKKNFNQNKKTRAKKHQFQNSLKIELIHVKTYLN